MRGAVAGTGRQVLRDLRAEVAAIGDPVVAVRLARRHRRSEGGHPPSPADRRLVAGSDSQRPATDRAIPGAACEASVAPQSAAIPEGSASMDLSAPSLRDALCRIDIEGWDGLTGRQLLHDVRRAVVVPVVRGSGLRGPAADQAEATGWAAAWDALRRPTARTALNPGGMIWTAVRRAVAAEGAFARDVEVAAAGSPGVGVGAPDPLTGRTGSRPRAAGSCRLITSWTRAGSAPPRGGRQRWTPGQSSPQSWTALSRLVGCVRTPSIPSRSWPITPCGPGSVRRRPAGARCRCGSASRNGRHGVLAPS